MDSWTIEWMPSEVDEVERTPMELKRLIDCYLLEKWGLIVVGITTSLVEVLKSSFVGSQIIVLDYSMDQTRFLYNSLEEVLSTSSGRRQTSTRDLSSSRLLYSVNEEDNVVDDVGVDLKDGEDLYS